MNLQQKLKNLAKSNAKSSNISFKEDKLNMNKKHSILSDIYSSVDTDVLNVSIDAYNLYLSNSGSNLDDDTKISFDEFLSVITAIKDNSS